MTNQHSITSPRLASTIQQTERGWAGHFCFANSCRFRRNTLLECGDTRIVVSTVGLFRTSKSYDFLPINKEYHADPEDDRYFETKAFHAVFDGRYWDADFSLEISFESPWCISEVDADIRVANDRANDQHEAVVWEISARLASGDTDFARSGQAINQLENN